MSQQHQQQQQSEFQQLFQEVTDLDLEINSNFHEYIVLSEAEEDTPFGPVTRSIFELINRYKVSDGILSLIAASNKQLPASTLVKLQKFLTNYKLATYPTSGLAKKVHNLQEFVIHYDREFNIDRTNPNIYLLTAPTRLNTQVDRTTDSPDPDLQQQQVTRSTTSVSAFSGVKSPFPSVAESQSNKNFSVSSSTRPIVFEGNNNNNNKKSSPKVTIVTPSQERSSSTYKPPAITLSNSSRPFGQPSAPAMSSSEVTEYNLFLGNKNNYEPLSYDQIRRWISDNALNFPPHGSITIVWSAAGHNNNARASWSCTLEATPVWEHEKGYKFLSARVSLTQPGATLLLDEDEKKKWENSATTYGKEFSIPSDWDVRYFYIGVDGVVVPKAKQHVIQSGVVRPSVARTDASPIPTNPVASSSSDFQALLQEIRKVNTRIDGLERTSSQQQSSSSTLVKKKNNNKNSSDDDDGNVSGEEAPSYRDKKTGVVIATTQKAKFLNQTNLEKWIFLVVENCNVHQNNIMNPVLASLVFDAEWNHLVSDTEAPFKNDKNESTFAIIDYKVAIKGILEKYVFADLGDANSSFLEQLVEADNKIMATLHQSWIYACSQNMPAAFRPDNSKYKAARNEATLAPAAKFLQQTAIDNKKNNNNKNGDGAKKGYFGGKWNKRSSSRSRSGSPGGASKPRQKHFCWSCEDNGDENVVYATCKKHNKKLSGNASAVARL